MRRNPAVNLPAPVLWLGLVFFAVHALRQLLSAEADRWVLLAFAFIPARYGPLAHELPGGVAACLWSPLTYAFLHADWVHLGVNLIWMASFGGALARRLKSLRFFALSTVSAMAGAALQYLVSTGEGGIVIGASGAISGMMAATARFAFAPGGPLSGAPAPGEAEADRYRVPDEGLRVVLTRSRALAFILVWFVVNLLFGMNSGLLPGASGPIAWEAHVGGFLAGLLLFPLFDPVGRRQPPETPDGGVSEPC
jgi:membrane associated rhomboid family serine protease